MNRAFVVLIFALVLLADCGKLPDISAKDFVGTWQSSRLSTPIILDEHGGWEIHDDVGRTLQYGVWIYRERNRTIEWVFKHRSGITQDINPILSVNQDGFTLREQDGTVTTFRRIRK